MSTNKLPRLTLLACFSLQALLAFAQNPADMPLRQVISEAQELIANNKFAEASPYLDELEIRFEDEKDPSVERILQEFGFVRGVGYLQSYAESGNDEFLGKAASAFGSFAEKFPDDPRSVLAMQKRTDCLRALQEWMESATVIETLLAEPFRSKIVKRSELLDLFFGRAQCYHILQNWSKGESSFRELLAFADKAKDEDRSAYAVSCLTEMFVQTKRIDEVFQFLPRLSGDTPARYDLRLNVNLMQGAGQLKDAGRNTEASLLYALTMTAEEIEVYYSEREKRLTAERKRLTDFLNLYGSGLPSRRLEILREENNKLALKLTSAKSQLAMVRSTPSYTTTLRWRKSDNFQATRRNWESFWGFYWLYKDFPEHENVENFIYAAFASANKVKFRDKSIELGEEYLSNKEWKNFRPDVTFIMSNAYREEAIKQQSLATSLQTAMTTIDKERAERAKETADEYYDRFFSLCDDFLGIMPDHKYSTDFINMMGSVYFKRRKFDDMLEKFVGLENGVMNANKGYINDEEFLNSPAMSSALYMSGLGLLATGKFDEAKPLLAPIIGVHVEGLPLSDGSLGNSFIDEGSLE